MMRYEKYSFIYPPRPEKKINPMHIAYYDTEDFIAQPKYNGSCCSVFLDGTSVVIRNRHDEVKRRLEPDMDLAGLHSGNGYMVLAGELMDKSKVGEDDLPIRGFIIWDIMVYSGEYLIGSTVEQRIALMDRLWPTTRMQVTKAGMKQCDFLSFTNAEKVYRTTSFTGGLDLFTKLYNDICKTPAYEGFVLKKRMAKLEMGFNPTNNSTWQLKVRKQTKMYQF